MSATRLLFVFGFVFYVGCTTAAPEPTLGGAQGAACVQNLDCAQGLYCMCERCIARDIQTYPSHCPHLELLLCDESEGQCTASCDETALVQEAECLENLWFCPENQQLIQLCTVDETDLDASIP